MGGGKPVGDADGDLHGLTPGNRSPPQPLTERLAFQQLGHDEGDAVFVSDVMDRQNVGMREGGDGFGLPLEAGQRIGVICQAFRQHLDRHVAIEARVAGAVHLSHAARAEGSENFIGTKLIPGRQAHRFVSSSRQLRTTWMRGVCFSHSAGWTITKPPSGSTS